MAKLRTFIAVDASLEMRRAAARLAGVLRPVAGDVRWVTAETLHWTLQFLGDVDDLEIPAVCKAVSEAVVEFEAFELEARGVGAFPAPDRPRTLWLGAGAGAEPMVALHDAIRAKLNRLGFRGEQRRYVPHLTVGRAEGRGPARSLACELGAHAEFDGGTTFVDEVVVYSSTLGPEGPTYDALAHVALG